MSEKWLTNYKGERFLSYSKGLLEEFIKDTDWRSAESFRTALDEVASKMPEKITIGALARIFPDYQHLLLDILDTLKEIKFINFEDWRPMPTLITKYEKELSEMQAQKI